MSKTVTLPDGYNGHTLLFFAEPVVEWPDGTVRVQCAETGKEYMARWIDRAELDKAVEAQSQPAGS